MSSQDKLRIYVNTHVPDIIDAPPNCRPECIINSDCPQELACSSRKYPGIRGINANYRVRNHIPIRVCNQDYTGDPFFLYRLLTSKENKFIFPLLIILLVFLGFTYYKSKIKTCNNCGTISLNLSETCINCGANLNDINKINQLDKKPSESTIEVQAEEIK